MAKNEVTLCGFVSIEEAKRLKEDKTAKEEEDLRILGLKAIEEVRATLLKNLDTMPQVHRDMIQLIINS
jgi:hypothetical protein